MKKYKIVLAAAFLIIPSISFASDMDTLEDEKSNENIIYYDYSLPMDIDDYDDSILVNTSYGFYNEEGKTEVDIDNYEDSNIFVNGKKITNEKELKNNLLEGKNHLDILDSKESTNVKIKTSKKEEPTESEDDELDEGTIELLENILDQEVKENFSGGQISVIRNNKEVYNHSFGYKNNFYKDGRPIEMENREKVDENTMFDLASNTKMYVTNYALQKLLYEGKISLDDKVSKYFLDFKDGEDDKIKGKDAMTIRDIRLDFLQTLNITMKNMIRMME